MRIGDLDKRIELQKKTQVSDNMGGFTDTYTTECNPWASIWSISAKDQILAGQMAMTITHRIRIRYRKVLRPDWRIKYGNKFYVIVSIINENISNKYLEILAKEIL